MKSSKVGKKRHIDFKMTDFVPAISGLIGKIALVSSFALVWEKELGITSPNFVLNNVRIEVLIGSIITLIGVILFANASPAGTLAPLVVLVPAMAAFGVHPLVLGVLVGLIGLLAIKSGLFKKLIGLSGFISKTSITLTFGISGLVMSTNKLNAFFGGEKAAFFALLLILLVVYIVLYRYKKNWLIIPVAAVVSFLVPYVFGLGIHISTVDSHLTLNPDYWWNNMWGIGYGFELVTILKTLPFAIFVILLWTIDTVSIQTIQEANHLSGEEKEDIDIDRSFLIVCIRNVVGAIFGGAQTGSLWRSFLIPLFMVKRPMRTCTIILGIAGVLASLTLVPIQVMSYIPLVWSVLLFGIFMPFTVTAILNMVKAKKLKLTILIVIFAGLGVFINPIITWVISVIWKKFFEKED